MEKHLKNTRKDASKQFHRSLLMKEVKEKVQLLKEYGMSDEDIMSSLYDNYNNQSLAPLIVSRNYKLFVGEERLEIHMEPLVKAVYLLFLKHPEGILFKHLPDYRKELTEIYVKLKPYGLSDRVVQSIEDVTNPLLNSINEKCARIRGAFVGQFDNHLAQHYYIDGKRGEAKKIALPRDLVVWE